MPRSIILSVGETAVPGQRFPVPTITFDGKTARLDGNKASLFGWALIEKARHIVASSEDHPARTKAVEIDAAVDDG